MYGRMRKNGFPHPPPYRLFCVAAALAPYPSDPSADPAGGRYPLVSLAECVARPICFRLFAHCVRAAASRTFCTAGSRSPMRMAMMAMTTNNSMSVNARRPAARMKRGDTEGALRNENRARRASRTGG